jgi:putative acetyltransferase
VAATLDVTIARERPDQPDVCRLIAALDVYAMSLYPPESNHLLDIAALSAPCVAFLVARLGREAVGCGALKFDDRGWGEIKRMYVDPAARGRGIGARLLASLEALASAKAVQLLRLETGIHNVEALAMYRRSGYRECEPFGDYAHDPLSVFMEKVVARTASTPSS